MAYPFVKFPSFSEFRNVLEKEFGCEYKKLPAKITDPSGADHEVFYLERKVQAKRLFAAVDIADNTILTPSVLRSICARLEVPVARFGLHLG